MCERRHVSQRWLDQAVRRVAQEVPEQAGLGDRDTFWGEADLGGVGGRVVGGVKVEVCNVPEPACRDREKVNMLNMQVWTEEICLWLLYVF